MELKDFVGKIVISPTSNKRLVLYQIKAPEISAWTEKPEAHGHHTCYCWKTINGDPISTGCLIFEDKSLTEPFKAAYEAYCKTEAAYWEEYEYWMRRS